MTNYYVRETPDGADVLNRISVTISALVCTCYEVSTAQQIVNALNAQAPPAAVAVAVPEGMVMVQRAERLARELLADECERETHCRPATVIRSLASGTVFERAALRAIARATGETK